MQFASAFASDPGFSACSGGVELALHLVGSVFSFEIPS
jgi:hypothetical protein